MLVLGLRGVMVESLCCSGCYMLCELTSHTVKSK